MSEDEILFVIIGRDWSFPKYQPTNPLFEFEVEEGEDVGEENERLGNVVQRGCENLEALPPFIRRGN